MSNQTADRQTVSDRDYRDVCEFLFREAQLLDNWRLEDWLAVLTPDMTYRLTGPVLSTVSPGANDTVVTYMDETFGSLKARVKKLSTPAHTIAENPRSFSRRFVCNILIDSISKDGLIRVNSNALMYRSRGTHTDPHFFSTARCDSLRRVDGKLYLARRDAMLDESVIGSRNIVALL